MAVFIDIPGIGNIEAKNAASESTLTAILEAITGVRKNTGVAAGGGASMAGKTLVKSFAMLGFAAGKVTSGLASVASASVSLGEKTLGAADSLSKLDGSASSAADMFNSIPLVGKAFSIVAGAADRVNAAFTAASASGATFGGSIMNFSKAASEAGMNMAEFGALIAKNGEGMLAFGSNTEDGAKNFATVSKSLRGASSDLYALGMSTADINSGLANYGALLRQQGLQGKKSNVELAVGAKNYLKEMDALAKITGEERSAKEAQAKQLAGDAQFQASMMGMNEEVRASFRNTVLGLPGPLQSFTKDMLANGVATTEENQKLMAMMPQSAAMLQQMQAKMARGEQVTTEERNRLNNLMKDEGGRNLQNIKQAGAASAELAGMVNSLAATQQINTDGVKEATEAQKKAQANTDGFNKKMQEFQQRISTVSNTFQGLLATSGVLDVLMNAFDAVAKLAEQYLIPAFNIVSSIVMKVGSGMMMLLAPVIEYITEKFGSGGLGGTLTFIDGLMNTVFDALGGMVRGAILAFEGVYNGVMMLVDPLQRLYTSIFGVSDGTDTFGAILIDVGSVIGSTFELLGSVLGFVIDNFLVPLGPIIGGVMTVFGSIGSFIKDNLVPILAMLGTALIVSNIATIANTAVTIAKTIAMIALLGPLAIAAIAFVALTSPITAVVVGVGLLIAGFKYLYDTGWTFGTVLEAIGDRFKRFFIFLQEGFLAVLDKITFGDANKAVKVSQAALVEEKKALDDKEKLRDAIREQNAAEIEANKKGKDTDDAARNAQKAGLEEDKKSFAERKISSTALTGLAAREAKAKEDAVKAEEKKSSVDYNAGAEDQLKQFAGQQGSALVPKDQQASAKADSAKDTLVSDAESKKATDAAAKKAAEEKLKEYEMVKEAAKPTDAARTQESAETLLAQLNTNMTRLIQITQEQKSISEDQLRGIKGMSGNLFA